MEFEDHDEHEEEDEDADEQEDEITLPGPYNTLGNSSSRVKMSNSASEPTALALPSPRKPRYRECLKNHAVGIAGHAVDGCGEFMPSGSEGTLDALKCAACNCHRNFHRKETDVSSSTGSELMYLANHHQQQQQHFSPYYRTPAGYLHVAQHHRPLALPSTSGEGRGTHSREDEEDMSNPSGGGGGGGGGGMMMMGTMGGGSSSKKRFRTKFTSEQKERMMELAERLGWRIQKHDEAVVQQFCNDTGVKRHVLKVWMHNNKHTIGKKPADDHAA